MLRFTVALLLAMVVSGSGISADQAMARRGWHRAAVILPAGLPRSHYNFRTTISYGTPYTYRAYPYDYHGPYYGGPYVGYWDRLPYACGVYGYC